MLLLNTCVGDIEALPNPLRGRGRTDTLVY